MSTTDNIVRLTFLGDVMCKSQMISEYLIDDGKYDFSDVFNHMKPYFEESDFVFANMETPISYDNIELTSEQFNFNSPYEFAEAAYKSGIDFVATANNHCLDRGIIGIDSTIKSLNRIGFLHTGVFTDFYPDMPLIVEIGGIKFGVLAYTYGTNAFANNNYLKKSDIWRVNLFQNQEMSFFLDRFIYKNKGKKIAKILSRLRCCTDRVNSNRMPYERIEKDKKWKKKIKDDIKKIKKLGTDYVIMYMHAGGQYNIEATNETKKLAQWLVDNGVDIVAGSHEHVVHGGDFARISSNKIVTYSLGNFDGVAGVYDKPFDKMAEYSIAWNVYINKESKKIVKSTYSILKTIKDNNRNLGIKTIPVYELYNMLAEEERENLWNETMIIAKRFSGQNIEKYGMLAEYII